MKKRSLPLSQVYRHLEPGPVVLLTTSAKGRDNVMTMSWLTMLEFEPPLVGCVVSDRDFSFGLLRTAKECAINIPTARIARKAVACGNMSGAKIDKFARIGLTKAPAEKVRAPLVEECYASFECKVVDTRLVNKYGFFVLEVVKAWSDPREKNPKTLHHRGKGVFMIAGRTVKLPSTAR